MYTRALALYLLAHTSIDTTDILSSVAAFCSVTQCNKGEA